MEPIAAEAQKCSLPAKPCPVTPSSSWKLTTATRSAAG